MQKTVENEIFNNCAIIDVGSKSKDEEIDDVLGIFGDSDSDNDADETRDYFQGRLIVIEHVGIFGAGILQNTKFLKRIFCGGHISVLSCY